MNVQDLVEAEQEAMTMVGHIVWSFEDTCATAMLNQFSQPVVQTKRAPRLNATNPQDDESDPRETDDTNELILKYYQQTMSQVTEFAQTILFSVLFYKWAESRNGTTSTSPSKWKETLPDILRQATRAKANRILYSLLRITRLRLDALDHVYDALHRAEQLTYEYIARKGDNVLSPYIGHTEQRAAFARLEDDAVNFVNRQILTQLKLHQEHANQELYNAMTDIINTSIENTEYCQRLHEWAQSSVAFSNVTTGAKRVDDSSETSATELAEDLSESNTF